MEKEKVAIVGSRDFPDLFAVRQYVANLPPTTIVVSGNARGVDKTAQDAAIEAGLEVWIIPANWKNGRGAGYARNHRVVEVADRIVVFWDGSSTGTKHVMEIATEKGYTLFLSTVHVEKFRR